MLDKKVIKALKKLASQEKKGKEFRKRVRAKSEVVSKSLTKKGNIKLGINFDTEVVNFIVLKNHKDRFALASKLKEGDKVHIEGLDKLNMIICIKLSRIENIDTSKQQYLADFSK